VKYSCEFCRKSGACDIQMLNVTTNCPCSECVIKMICTTKICKDLNEYHKEIFHFDHEDYKLCTTSV
jgi:hypothetical protein